MINKLERISVNGWPPQTKQNFNDQLFTSSGGNSRRINTVYLNSIGHASYKSIADYAETYYTSLNLIPTFKITSTPEHKDFDNFLASRAYALEAKTKVLTLDLTNIEAYSYPNCQTSTTISQKWLDSFLTMSPPSEETIYRLAINRITQPTLYLQCMMDDTVVGVANGVIEDGYIGIFNVHVLPSYRGRSLGKQIMSTLLFEAKLLGIHTAYLQVESKNNIALNLYTSFGFNVVYDYWYRRKYEL